MPLPYAIFAITAALSAVTLGLAAAAVMKPRRGAAIGAVIATLAALATPTLLAIVAVVDLGGAGPIDAVMRATLVAGALSAGAWAAACAGGVLTIVVPVTLGAVTKVVARTRTRAAAVTTRGAQALGAASLVIGITLIVRVRGLVHAFLSVVFAAPQQRADLFRAGVAHVAIDPAASTTLLALLWALACIAALVPARTAATNGHVAPPSAVGLAAAFAVVGLGALAAASWGSSALGAMVSSW